MTTKGDFEHNPYQPPQAELDEELEGPDSSDDVAALYVLGIPKLIALQVLSLGFFSTYWFYRQWRDYARWRRRRVIAWGRALFALFYVVQLFRGIDQAGRDVGRRIKWSPANQAMLYLGLSLTALLLGRGSGYAEVGLGTLLPIAAVIPLTSAQRAANTAAGDPQGKTNARLTFQNLVWLALVWVVWGSIFASSYLFTRRFPVPQ
jgi:hypothetical protein